MSNTEPAATVPASKASRNTFANVVAIVAILFSAGSILVSVLIARGTIHVPQRTLAQRYRGHGLSGFGTACRVEGGDECANAWSYTIETTRVGADGKFTGTVTWSFGSKLAIEGEASNSLLSFTETKPVGAQFDPSTDVGCKYFFASTGQESEFSGTYANCMNADGSANNHHGTVWLAVEKR